MLTGDNGILTQTVGTKEANIEGAEKEQIRLAMQSKKMEKVANNISKTVTSEELENQLLADGVKNVTVESGENDSLVVTYQESKNAYTVNQDGEIGENGQNPGKPEEGESLPSTSDTKPFLPDGAEVIEADLEKGVVIKDSNGNEWTWIEVPKSIYANIAYNGGTAPTSSTDSAKIESTMRKYTETYGLSYTDEWYSESQHGFASAEEYNNHKNTMLKSVYENGGFYIGKYEAGTEILRTSSGANLATPVIKEGAYPYNFITCKQAQEKSKELVTGGKTSSLMFGIQWDLVMTHIKNKKQSELGDFDTSWGNFGSATFEITKGEYSTDNGNTFVQVEKTYTKPAYNDVLLTTGATKRNSVLNIYDLAGNEWEWTLETHKDDIELCISRGGYYGYNFGYEFPVFYRNKTISLSECYTGFRPALW